MTVVTLNRDCVACLARDMDATPALAVLATLLLTLLGNEKIEAIPLEQVVSDLCVYHKDKLGR